jgi:NAD(P)H dehydrogenase (quinone)
MHAPGQSGSDVPIVTPDVLTKYDAFLFGVPTRYGNYSAQWKTFIDQLGGLWQSAALYGKYFGLFVSTGTAGGGQESTAIAAMSSWVHQGMIYVPLGYGAAFPILADLSEVRGESCSSQIQVTLHVSCLASTLIPSTFATPRTSDCTDADRF